MEKLPCRSYRQWAFGIGTFNLRIFFISLDGEIALIDGTFYQVKSDGKVYKSEIISTQTPFSTVTFFNPEFEASIAAVNYEELKSKIDS